MKNGNFEVIVLGRDLKRFPVENLANYKVTELKDFYQLKARLSALKDIKVFVIQYAGFLDDRHLNAFNFMMKEHNNLVPIFVTKEIGLAMKDRLGREPYWRVYWTTDRFSLDQIHDEIQTHILREYSRKETKKDVLLGPSALQHDGVEASFKPFMGAVSQNLSEEGMCIAVSPTAPFKEKDFVSLNYRKEDGDYATFEGQIRWIGRNKKRHQKLIGVQYVGKK